MTYKTYKWKSRDKKCLFIRCWRTENDSRKTVLMIHGLGEHSGRYKEWAAWFNREGFNFVSFDLRGHGKSSGKRGYARSLKVLLDDIDLVYSKIRKMFPDTGIILYGHSMGGNLALNHVIDRNKPLDALIVTSPWLKLEHEPHPFLIWLVKYLQKVFPRLGVGNGLSGGSMTHDEEKLKEMREDPLYHKKITLRLFYLMYHSGYFALRNVYKINYPFLLMHGTADQVTSWKASRNYVRNTTQRTHLKLWDEAYHELHNEVNREEVFQYLRNWLREYKL